MGFVEDALPPGWWVSLYAEAGECGGTFVSTRRRASRGLRGAAVDPERSAREAARRASTRLRRYAAANRLTRFVTLTYAGEGCHDPSQARSDVAAFVRDLRPLIGGQPFPYIWVPEWHPNGHGLHFHLALGKFVHRSRIRAAWPHGFIKINLHGDLPSGAGDRGQARRTAGYLAKYVSKTFRGQTHPFGLHRYEVGQGFQPERVRFHARTAQEGLERCSEVMGASPLRIWNSDQEETWPASPAVWAQWA